MRRFCQVLRELAVVLCGAVAPAAASACLGSSAQQLCSGSTGSVDCTCYANSTCNAGLVCYSRVCVAVPEGGLEVPAEASAPTDGAPSAANDGRVNVTGDTGAGDAAATSSSGGDTGALPAPGTNLITNGDFSQGMSLWSIVSGNGMTTATGSQLCVTVNSMQSAILGWPEPAGTPGPALVAGAMYTLSYSAQATPATTVDAKVGHSSAPYATDYETPMGGDSVPSAFMTFTHTFPGPTSPAETSAGLAFTIPATGSASGNVQVCFENVSLVQE